MKYKYNILQNLDNIDQNDVNDIELNTIGQEPTNPASSHKQFGFITFKNILTFLLIWCIIILTLSYFDVIILFNKRTFFKQDDAIVCSPMNLNYTHEKFLIDGIYYPIVEKALHRNNAIEFDCLNRNKNIKRIFAWTSFFSDQTFSYGFGQRKPFEANGCPVTNCELTNKTELLNSSQLVLVHMRDPIRAIPRHRPEGQRWVFVLYESPIHANDYSIYNGLFNLTSTYRRDSDFSHFYESGAMLNWELNEQFDENKNFLASKKKFSAIVVSNCGASNRRLDYIKELQKYISVDIFGKCGKPCPITFSDGKSGNCKDILGSEYKFYFAFENSNCYDYITEKFFNILKYNIIPVVLGGGKYDYYIPKSGFINAMDFKNPKELANYLDYLNQNASAYNSYFKWRKYVKFNARYASFSTICDMCIKLNLEEYFGYEHKTIEDIGEYWSKENFCYMPDLGLPPPLSSSEN